MSLCSSGFSLKMDEHTELQTLVYVRLSHTYMEEQSMISSPTIFAQILSNLILSKLQDTAPLQCSQSSKRKKVQDIQVKQHKEILAK